MSDSDQPSPKVRPIGGTENSWCKAASGGTGITVLSLLFNKHPNLDLLQNALHKLQNYHPILRANLHFDPLTTTFSLVIPPPSASTANLQPFDHQSTAQIIQSEGPTVTTPFQILLEHELNNNPWENLDRSASSSSVDVMHVSVYEIEEGVKWTVMMKLHTGVCDRTAAFAVMKELMGLMMKNGGGTQEEEREEITFMAQVQRLSNLDFIDPDSPRSSRVARLLLDSDPTTKLLEV
ncbi:Gag polyprotein [Bienertia sinuspersici]